MSSPIDVATLDALVAAGATAEMIVAAVKAQQRAQNEKLARKRAADAARQRKRRASRGHRVTERDMGVTERDRASPDQPVACSEPPQAQYVAGTENAKEDRLIDRGSDTRARESKSLITPEAHALADECRKAVGATIDDYYGLEYQTGDWLKRGYQPLHIVAAFVDMVHRYGPKDNMRYIDKVITTACSRAPPPPQRTLPLLQTIEGTSHGNQRRGRSDVDDLIHPAVRTTSFSVFAADLQREVERRDDSAA